MDALLKWIFSFLVLVWRMRQLQNAYFKHRKYGDLVEARRYENQVDDELRRRLVIKNDEPVRLDAFDDLRPTDKQNTLFE